MHVLALVNQKGGCGKTTTALNLAAALAARAQKVVLVDLDPQAHATLGLGCAAVSGPTIGEVLRGRATLRSAARPAPGGFDLVPASAALAEVEEIAARSIRPEQALARAFDAARLEWEFALLDCPPRADGVLTANALRAADTAVLVIESGVFALQGAIRAVGLLEQLARKLDDPFDVRAVATLFDPRVRVAREVLLGMHAQFQDLLFDTAIRASADLREAAAHGVPVQLHAPRSSAALDFAALALEVLAHAGESRSRSGRARAPAPAAHASRPVPTGSKALRT